MLTPRLFVVGFKSDYGNIDIKQLSESFKVKRIIPSSAFVFIALRIKKISPSLFCSVCDLYFNIKCREINESDVLVSDDNTVAIRSLFNENFESINKICIYRNTSIVNIYDYGLKNILAYSFDFDDCGRYGYRYYNQYCSGYDFLLEYKSLSPTIDVYFIGRNKGRSEFIYKIKESLVSYAVNIKLVDSRAGLFKSNYISYFEHCNNIINSRVILDVVKPGQSGLTMRSIEALLTGRKIITNNDSIFKYDGFNTSNTLLIDNSLTVPTSVLDEFINRDVELFSKDMNMYSPRVTLKKIIEDSEMYNE